MAVRSGHQAPLRPALVVLAALAAAVQCCSNFAMEDGYLLSARTEDLGVVPYHFALVTVPTSTPAVVAATHGYVAFTAMRYPPPLSLNATQGVKAGLNDEGLSCDKQTLINSTYPQPSATKLNLDAALLCRWALEGHDSIAAVRRGLAQVNFVRPVDPGFFDGHWSLRDKFGQGLVIEFIEGELKVYQDNNDKGLTGFGIMTNEPPFPWQLEAVRHLEWKMKLARPAVSLPGGFYPDERFQRIFLVKSNMPRATSYQSAVANAVHVLNTVTVPLGSIGTDSGPGEGQADRTHFGVIYDHVNRTVYWRSAINQNLQRLRLADAGLGPTGVQQHLIVSSSKLEWFHDAAGTLERAK